MSNGDDLNFSPEQFAVDDGERKLSEQKSARGVRTNRPTARRLNNFGERSAYLGVEFASSVRAAPQVPIERLIVLN